MNEAAAAVPGAVTTAAAAVPTDPALHPPRDRRSGWLRIDFSRTLKVRRAGEKEALALTLLCALDMYTTLWWVITGQAREGNRIIAWTFNHTPILFVIIKCASCLPALLLAPRLAEKHPKLTIWLLRGILLAYIGLYLMNVK